MAGENFAICICSSTALKLAVYVCKVKIKLQLYSNYQIVSRASTLAPDIGTYSCRVSSPQNESAFFSSS